MRWRRSHGLSRVSRYWKSRYVTNILGCGNVYTVDASLRPLHAAAVAGALACLALVAGRRDSESSESRRLVSRVALGGTHSSRRDMAEHLEWFQQLTGPTCEEKSARLALGTARLRRPTLAFSSSLESRLRVYVARGYYDGACVP